MTKARKRPKVKRKTEGELLVRRAQVAQYHRLGWSPEKIAVHLGMPLPSVWVDLQFLRKFPEYIEHQSPYAVAIAAIADEVLAGDHRGIKMMLEVLRRPRLKTGCWRRRPRHWKSRAAMGGAERTSG